MMHDEFATSLEMSLEDIEHKVNIVRDVVRTLSSDDASSEANQTAKALKALLSLL